MDDNRIEIVARLDTSRAAVVKIEADLSKITDQLNKDQALKIIANVDLSKTTQRIQSQLATISKNIKLDIGNINLNSNANVAVKQMESLGKATTQTQKEIKKVENSLANISGDYLNPIKPVIKGGYLDADATMKALKNQLSSLGQTISVTGDYGDKEEAQFLKSMTAEIKASSGEVRTLTFAWSEFDKAFFATTGKFSDKGIGKVQQDIVRLEKELANFKSSHQAIETGLTEPLTKATDAIDNLKAGVGSVETAQKALDNLKTAAAKIGANLKSAGSSFNIFDNAINKAQNFDNTIKELSIDIGKLQFTDKRTGLVESLELAKQRLQEFKQVESESGKGLEWSQRYGEINSLLQGITNNLKAAKKEESEIDAFNRKLDAHNKEIQKKLNLKEQEIQKAKELNEVEMGNYWQGRFEEAVKAQTAENEVLKDMKKYYEDYNKAQKEAENQQKKAFADNNKLAQLQNRINNLAADMDRYAAANKRAVESTKKMTNGKTFADEWARLTSEMAKGADLTDQELKNLIADFRVFGKEAETVGLKGESAFGKFFSSFKTMSSYITANMVFNAAKRQLSQMIEEVKAVDSAMVELRKVTTATEYEFQEFAKSATKTGIELGASVSDVINATATFARLGESLPDAEELGRVATLYKNVGDGIDIETASEDLISTMKAFKIETKDAIKLVDKFNEVEACPFYILVEKE